MVGTIASHIARHNYLRQVPPSFGDDVNNPQERARDILGRIRPPDDFHALNQVYVKWELCPNQSPVVDVIVGAVTINHQRDTIVVLPWKSESSHSKVAKPN
jgi:hypothetical protein